MCLTKSGGYKIAKEDIICFKFCVTNPDGMIASPFYTMYWELGKEETARKKSYDVDPVRTRYVEGGFFHTYQEKDDCRAQCVMRRALQVPYRGYSFDMFSCVIPKGSKYYEGFYNGRHAYASKSLIIKEKLNFYEK